MFDAKWNVKVVENSPTSRKYLVKDFCWVGEPMSIIVTLWEEVRRWEARVGAMKAWPPVRVVIIRIDFAGFEGEELGVMEARGVR